MSADLTILKDPRLALLTVGLVVIASIGKFAGAFTGGMASGLSSRESLALGCGMNARGSTEVIVATIGLSIGALTQNLYTMIVTMAVITTMAMPPMLRWALRRLPLGGEEKARLDREELDAKGFVAQLERLLITADKSPSGEFATRLAGFVAGQGGLPITVLQLEKTASPERSPANTLKDIATESAKGGHRSAEQDKGEEKQERVEISARTETKIDEAVQKEAAKGYDMLFIGLERMRRPTALLRGRQPRGQGVRRGDDPGNCRRTSGGFEGRGSQHSGSGERHGSLAPRRRNSLCDFADQGERSDGAACREPRGERRRDPPQAAHGRRARAPKLP